MYAPKQAREDDPAVLAAAIRAIQFATVVTAADGAYHASHMPMVLREAAGGWVLEGHVARGNGHWGVLPLPSLAVFQGPQAYVSPGWYPAKQEHGRVVPTWTYIAVHARGVLEAVTDPAWLMAHLAALTDANEAPRAAPWAMGDAPGDYIAGMVRGVVGVRLAVARVEGAWKLGQHRSAADRAGTVAGLEADGQGAMAAAMRGGWVRREGELSAGLPDGKSRA